MSRFRLVVSAAAFALFAAACGGAASTAAPATQTQADAPVEEVVSPLTGTFQTIANTEIDLAELQGQDVVLWFWAPW